MVVVVVVSEVEVVDVVDVDVVLVEVDEVGGGCVDVDVDVPPQLASNRLAITTNEKISTSDFFICPTPFDCGISS